MDEKKLPELIDENQYPDFWEQIKSFQEFAKDVGQGAASGNGFLASKELQEKRIEICNECPDYNKDQKRCYKCGCFMEHKIKFANVKCPASKW
jgi:hypothetical protein